MSLILGVQPGSSQSPDFIAQYSDIEFGPTIFFPPVAGHAGSVQTAASKATDLNFQLKRYVRVVAFAGPSYYPISVKVGQTTILFYNDQWQDSGIIGNTSAQQATVDAVSTQSSWTIPTDPTANFETTYSAADNQAIWRLETSEYAPFYTPRYIQRQYAQVGYKSNGIGSFFSTPVVMPGWAKKVRLIGQGFDSAIYPLFIFDDVSGAQREIMGGAITPDANDSFVVDIPTPFGQRPWVVCFSAPNGIQPTGSTVVTSINIFVEG